MKKIQFYLTPSAGKRLIGKAIAALPDVRKAVEEKQDTIKAFVVGDTLKEITLKLGDLTDNEREIILKGCLINYYKG